MDQNHDFDRCMQGETTLDMALSDMTGHDVPHAGLSTDYLNHFGEALMLIEMACSNPDMIGELCAWQPTSYREHFSASDLRCAAAALAAYDRLDDTARRAFETLCSAMTRLVDTVILTLRDIGDTAAAQPVIDVAAVAFHNLLGRATAFINSGGDMHTAAYDKIELQVAIDRIIAG